MKKVELPIEKEKIISPLKPDFKWFFKIFFTTIFSIIIIYVGILGFSKYIIANISIEKERELFGDFYLNIVLEGKKEIFNKKILGENIGELKNFEIYISDDNITNAFTIPGAHIIITKGLLNEVKTKEELLFILAHELGHIKNRDIIKNFSKDLPFTMILNFLGIDFGGGPLNSNTIITNFFSRDAEKKADAFALEFMNKLELNSKCAERFFKKLGNNENKYLEFMVSHPINPDRIDFINKNSKFKEKKCENFN